MHEIERQTRLLTLTHIRRLNDLEWIFNFVLVVCRTSVYVYVISQADRNSSIQL